MSAQIVLLPGEQVVMSSDRDTLTLTKKRVRYDSAVLGSSSFVSITLDSVASCSLATKSYPLLLLLGALVLIGALTQGGDVQVMFIFSAAVLAVIYFLTRRAVIAIGSNGGREILVPTKGMSRAAIIEFLDAIEREKLKGNA